MESVRIVSDPKMDLEKTFFNEENIEKLEVYINYLNAKKSVERAINGNDVNVGNYIPTLWKVNRAHNHKNYLMIVCSDISHGEWMEMYKVTPYVNGIAVITEVNFTSEFEDDKYVSTENIETIEFAFKRIADSIFYYIGNGHSIY